MVRLEPDAPAVVAVELACERWGGYLAGGMTLRAPGPLGLIRFEQVVEASVPVRVYPAVERLRALPRPAATNVGSGNYVTRIRGEGLEFADLRPHVPGDRLRRVNWRVSARRGRLHVNEYHPERNADVVLFLDAFSDTRDGAGGTIDMTVRAAAALAAAYLRTRDRVGIVGFGGIMRWVLPSSGTTQVYRILDSVIDTQVVVSYAWRDVAYIPARTLPPHALVVALSPLSDPRMLSALADLRARGIDLAMIDVSPLPFVAAPPGSWASWPTACGGSSASRSRRGSGRWGCRWRSGGTAGRWTRCWPSFRRCGDTPEPCASSGAGRRRRPRPRSPPTRPRQPAAGRSGDGGRGRGVRGARGRDPRPLGGRRGMGDRARRGRLRGRAGAGRRLPRPVGAAGGRRPGRGGRARPVGDRAHRPAKVDPGIMRARVAAIATLAATGAGAGWLMLLVSNAGSGGSRSPAPGWSRRPPRWCSSHAWPAAR